MGSKNETVLSPAAMNMMEFETDAIHMYRSESDIHFRDDKNGLHVSVPVEDFWKAWTGIQAKLAEQIAYNEDTNHFQIPLAFWDKKAGAMLFILLEADREPSTDEYDINVIIYLGKATFSEAFCCLDDLAKLSMQGHSHG